MSYTKIHDIIKSAHPSLIKIPDAANSTSYNYKIKNHKGSIGLIAAYSRTFCGTCNRIRLTPIGTIKTCLYDDGVLNVRDLIRANKSDQEIHNKLQEAFNSRPLDGFEAEANRKSEVSESMTTIGG